MITRRSFLKYIPSAPILLAIPAGIIGNRLGVASKAKAESLIFTYTDEDKLLAFVARKSPAALKIRQDMNDDGSMTWTVLEIDSGKTLPQDGWDIRHEDHRFYLHVVDRKQGVIHTFWIKQVIVPIKFNDRMSLLNSVGNNQLLVRRECTPEGDMWVVLHREERRSKYDWDGHRLHHNGHIFKVDTITQYADGTMKLFMLWRSK